jgi:hypothetical protein
VVVVLFVSVVVVVDVVVVEAVVAVADKKQKVNFFSFDFRSFCC